VLDICDNDDVLQFIKETFTAAADDSKEADTETAVGGGDGARFSLDL
jgi:hypothetical protein